MTILYLSRPINSWGYAMVFRRL